MSAKRKSSNTAIGTSFYQLNGGSASKRRLLLEEEAEDGIHMTRTTTNTSIPSIRGPVSPTLENITTEFSSLQAPIPASNASTASTPRTPEASHSVVPPPPPVTLPRTCLVIGASRGIGLEFARQLLQQHYQVIAVVRDVSSASQLWQITGSLMLRPGSCIIEQCDVGIPAQIEQFISRMRLFVERGGKIDTIIVNAGILQYQKGLGSLDVEFEVLEQHLRINCIGNIVLARKLLMLNEIPILTQRKEQYHVVGDASGAVEVVVGKQVVFISSDSGSMVDFREYEDGFAAYGASKVALNMMIRHMATELRRRAQKKAEESKPGGQSYRSVLSWEKDVCVLAMHPGEVSTDMANIEVAWDVEGIISPEESVRDMLRVLEDKDSSSSGTFWRWDGTEHPW